MATIGTLAVNFIARTAPFEQKVNRARGTTRTFSRGVSDNMRVLKAWGGTLLAIGGAGGLGFVIRQSLSAADALGKVSDKLGITTEKMAGLRSAGELTGVSANTFDMAIQRMTRRLSEAAVGTGEAQAALVELGLDAQKLARLSGDHQFRAIADAMSRVESQADRVRLSFKLFDSEGVALVNTLRLGSAGLDKMQRDAENLGGAFNRLDIKKVEEANDTLARMKFAASALATRLTIALAPSMIAVVEGITAVIRSFREMSPETAQTAKYITRLALGFGSAVVLAPRIVAAIGAITRALKGMAGGKAILQGLSGPKGWIQLAVGAGVAAISIWGLDKAFASLQDKSKKLETELSRTMSKMTKTMTNAFDVGLDKTEQLTEATDGMTEAHKRWNDVMKQGEQLTKSLRTPLERYNDRLGDARKLLNVGAISLQTYQREVAAAQKALLAATDAQEKFNGSQQAPNVSAAVRGTVEGFAAVRQSRIDQLNTDREAKDKERNRLLDEINQQLARIGDNTEDGAGAEIEVVEHRI